MNGTIPPRFYELVEKLTAWLAGREVSAELAQALNADFPPDGPFFRELAGLCKTGLDQQWLGTRGEPPLRYGRVVKPGPQTHDFSIDVVLMKDVAGPHHTHPNGEIDMIVPLDPAARFDDHPEGWIVYGAQSSHAPTVTGGAAAILYALPKGAIVF